jgi:hypothetical protein
MTPNPVPVTCVVVRRALQLCTHIRTRTRTRTCTPTCTRTRTASRTPLFFLLGVLTCTGSSFYYNVNPDVKESNGLIASGCEESVACATTPIEEVVFRKEKSQRHTIAA